MRKRQKHWKGKERPEFTTLIQFVPPSYALLYITLNYGTCKGKYYQLEAMSTCQTVMHSSFVMVLCVILFCFTLALNRKAQEGKHPICIFLELWAITTPCESLLTPPITKTPWDLLYTFPIQNCYIQKYYTLPMDPHLTLIDKNIVCSSREAAREIAFWAACAHVQDKGRPIRKTAAQPFTLTETVHTQSYLNVNQEL